MKHFRHRRLSAATAAILAVLAAGPAAAISTFDATVAAAQTAPQSAAANPQQLAGEVEEISDELRETRAKTDVMVIPITILVGILAAGGALGIVFSFRDQRRSSQLHELTVGGEIASQRRSEQSYGSFLEQSQTTLSLVNDTLELAKEATDRAAHSMELKAKAQVDAIEERAQKLMLGAFGSGDFELFVDDDSSRSELHGIAEELRVLEGYLSLQDISLPQYTKFVKAIDQFLLDDTESALQALQLASQDRVVGDLQRFIEYWLGYMLTTVGEYGEAVARFRHDELNLSKTAPEYLQLERIIAETEFFQIAKAMAHEDQSGAHGDAGTPPERFEAVAKTLDRLATLAVEVEESDDQRAKRHTRLEVARARADVYEWVAYDPSHLDDPLDEAPIKHAEAVLQAGEGGGTAVDFPSLPAWQQLSDENAFRAWALIQARNVCEEQEDRDIDLDFALAECYFKLCDPRAEGAFEEAEHVLPQEFGELREKRRKASLQESVLICHSRLHHLQRRDADKRRSETRHIVQTSREAKETVSEMRQGRVTVFSQIQRRNVTQAEFKREIGEIVDQERLNREDE